MFDHAQGLPTSENTTTTTADQWPAERPADTRSGGRQHVFWLLAAGTTVGALVIRRAINIIVGGVRVTSVDGR